MNSVLPQYAKLVIQRQVVGSMNKITFRPTCDLFDDFPETARVPTDCQWQSFGGLNQFCGRVVTVECYNDNSQVKRLLEESDGTHQVLVVDGKASLTHALLGDMIATRALHNHWQGIVVYGAVRDVQILKTLPMGVMALGKTPRKSIRQGRGTTHGKIEIGGVEVQTGDHVYCDENGVLFLRNDEI